ncbi:MULTISPECIES: carbohydrate ABC transporter permease [Streptomyces]|jgi:xylobiose transport system permease protein|uniref:carbohydrate ABC transporter permease n=1 Tax=Streptomyces TaxID=1883 RepID=UPI001902C27C|nr:MULTISPECIES: carbohydrate ABC transporter permease [unclassified Streptomyces]MCU4745471.1 carbohydrate ABC transporter permease [Streptomyces sp. G-5]QQN79526.1 carbohydrate ABC transporter permease [Streptomyces sp. XC 2026]
MSGTGDTRSTSRRPAAWRRANLPAGAAAVLWLAIVAVPLYILVASTVQSRSTYLENGPLSLPTEFTLDSYRRVLEGDFPRYLLNTLIVTVSCAALVIVLAVTVAYSVIRTRSRTSRRIFQLFLLGLAIPSQAVIIPVYLMITELQLYDTLLAIILPTAAFSLPVSVLILVGSMRDIEEEQYESMALDGASPARVLWQLVVPMTRGGISTVGVFSALGAWNGFMFPLILTQSRENRVLTLGLYDYIGEFRVDIPALLAAVVLSIVPIFTAYLFARRQLINGLMGVGGR